jgi:hypothetical protein
LCHTVAAIFPLLAALVQAIHIIISPATLCGPQRSSRVRIGQGWVRVRVSCNATSMVSSLACPLFLSYELFLHQISILSTVCHISATFSIFLFFILTFEFVLLFPAAEFVSHGSATFQKVNNTIINDIVRFTAVSIDFATQFGLLLGVR